MSLIPAARWAALGISIASALLLLWALQAIRSRERVIARSRERLRDAQARAHFAAMETQEAGQRLMALRREHERVQAGLGHAQAELGRAQAELGRAQAELARYRSQLVTARAALASRGEPLEDDVGDPTTFVQLDELPPRSVDGAEVCYRPCPDEAAVRPDPTGDRG